VQEDVIVGSHHLGSDALLTAIALCRVPEIPPSELPAFVGVYKAFAADAAEGEVSDYYDLMALADCYYADLNTLYLSSPLYALVNFHLLVTGDPRSGLAPGMQMALAKLRPP
jgi:hypothetical protein